MDVSSAQAAALVIQTAAAPKQPPSPIPVLRDATPRGKCAASRPLVAGGLLAVMIVLFLLPNCLFTRRVTIGDAAVSLKRIRCRSPVATAFSVGGVNSGPLRVCGISASYGYAITACATSTILPSSVYALSIACSTRLLKRFRGPVSVCDGTDSRPTALFVGNVIITRMSGCLSGCPFALNYLTTSYGAVSFSSICRNRAVARHFRVCGPADTAIAPRVLRLPRYLSSAVAPRAVAPGRDNAIDVALSDGLLHSVNQRTVCACLTTGLNRGISTSGRLPVTIAVLPGVARLSSRRRRVTPRLALSSGDVSLPRSSGGGTAVRVRGANLSPLAVRSVSVVNRNVALSLSEALLSPTRATGLGIAASPGHLHAAAVPPQIVLVAGSPRRAGICVPVGLCWY